MFNFNTTLQSTSATSYVTLEESDNIIAFYGNTADGVTWTALTSSQKEKALMRSTETIDNSYTFLGGRVNLGGDDIPGQRLQWPRREVPRDGYYQNFNFDDVLVSQKIIPDAIKIGTTLFAVDMLTENRENIQPYNEVKNIKAGEVSIGFRDTSENLPNSYAITSRAHDYIKKYGKLRGGLNQIGKELQFAYGIR